MIVPLIVSRTTGEQINEFLQPAIRYGKAKMTGQVFEGKDKPVSRRVMCYHQRTGELVATTLSDDKGYFEFTELLQGVAYFLVSLDENNDSTHYNLTGKDLVYATE